MNRHLQVVWVVGKSASEFLRAGKGTYLFGDGRALAYDLSSGFEATQFSNWMYYFEVMQEYFRSLVRHASELGVEIVDVAFNDQVSMDPAYKMSLEQRLKSAIDTKDEFAMEDCLYLYGRRGVDTVAVEFKTKNVSVKYNRFGEMHLTGLVEGEDIHHSLESKPVRLLTGLVRIDSLT